MPNRYNRGQLPRQLTAPTRWNGTSEQPNESSWHHPQRQYSKYNNVEVLLLHWEADDLGVNTEVQKLEWLWRSRYNFMTYSQQIPSEDADDYVTTQILNFRRGKGPRDLLIVYYGGHALGSANQCTWIANQEPSSPTLNWLAVQGLLLEHSVNVLLILDCCYATYAARGSSMGDNWFLGASAKESLATGVSWRSFTSAMIRELERRAQLHKEDGRPFTVHSIHGSLTLKERDLEVTPVITRLTEHECDGTDLTPLPHPPLPRVQSSPSAPLYPPSSQPLGVHLPQRPRSPLPNFSMPGRDPIDSLPVAYPITDALRDESFSVRLRDLPASSSVSDIYHSFSDRLGQETRISRVGPLTTSQPKSAVVTFSSAAAARHALNTHDRRFRTRLSGEQTFIRLDDDFLGLSCLYSSSKSPDGSPTVDLVFIHGTDGHAINSFASHLANPTREASWLCAELPKFLEEAGIFPRIMTFGWAANVWLDPNQDNEKLGKACESLLQELKRERLDCKNRPMVFIGHGVGGLLVKQAVLDIINFSFENDHFENPIKSCFFFAVPHHSLAKEIGFAFTLAAMNSVVRHNRVPDFSQIESLRAQNQAIVPFSNEFNAVRQQYGIDIQCFYEAQTTADMYIVPKASALLDSDLKHSHPVNARFRDLMQLANSEQNLRQVLHIMRDTIQEKLSPKPALRPTLHKENIFPRLKGYDTVFIVDDSDSMAGPLWPITADVLANIASIAVKYDGDGVDVRFMNNYLEEEKRLNLDSSEKVMKLFKKVTPGGPTPTADILWDELNQYLVKLREKRNRKRLNLIVLTDGEPDDVQAVENVIVKCANQLKELRAHELQVGVQFVQIGADKAASEFLRSLDDDLMTKRNLDRDVRYYQHGVDQPLTNVQMVDTVLWNDGDEGWLYEKILLGGILKKVDDDNGR